jgi:aryl-alcohol dehydrogenase-like predicted oxidoreductase
MPHNEQTQEKLVDVSLGDCRVKRLGYGAMQLAGPGVFGPPRDHDAALAVLREAVAAGVDHIDTSDSYGPHVVNKLIREALSPYPRDLVIVTKVGAVRGEDGSWNPAQETGQLRAAVEDNLRNLGLIGLRLSTCASIPTIRRAATTRSRRVSARSQRCSATG